MTVRPLSLQLLSWMLNDLSHSDDYVEKRNKRPLPNKLPQPHINKRPCLSYQM